MENSKIGWTDHTFNPWRGCTKVSPGCANCYAETMSHRNPKTLGVWGPQGTRVVASEAAWKEPLKWNEKAKAAGERHRVFCASMADVFEDWGWRILNHDGDVMRYNLLSGDWGVWPGRATEHDFLVMQNIRARLFKLIDATPHLDWLLLTKRPENVLRMMPDYLPCHCRIPEWEGAGNHSPNCDVFKPRPNVWIGTTVENQQMADKRIPHLLKIPAAVRFLSCEPLLGPLNLELYLQYPPMTDGYKMTFTCQEWRGIDWVIVGGESGGKARPFYLQWAREIRDQVKGSDAALFVKQMGSNPIDIDRMPIPSGGIYDRRIPLKLAHSKGENPAEWPEDLRVQEFPKGGVR